MPVGEDPFNDGILGCTWADVRDCPGEGLGNILRSGECGRYGPGWGVHLQGDLRRWRRWQEGSETSVLPVVSSSPGCVSGSQVCSEA